MTNSKLLPFITYDEALAAALMCKGYKIQSCYKVKTKFCFTFQAAEELHKAIELYWDDKLFVNARRLLNTYQDIIGTTNNRSI